MYLWFCVLSVIPGILELDSGAELVLWLRNQGSSVVKLPAGSSAATPPTEHPRQGAGNAVTGVAHLLSQNTALLFGAAKTAPMPTRPLT